MSRGLFRLVGVRSVCWVVRDALRLVGHVYSTFHVFLTSSDIIVTERLNSRSCHF
jgi:hypothetical protein